ncbi:hypothetical protein [Xanthomonas phaseoli]|uniref:hypothetical protein n=1 Tax=Xanthomonas phaseoli TaxID=1985254 RepID=UPI00133028BE|nr:hypothetical protein [Xanthomonas phaseoli]
MHPTSERSARELIAEAEKLLQGNESLDDWDEIKSPKIFITGTKQLLESLFENGKVAREAEEAAAKAGK